MGEALSDLSRRATRRGIWITREGQAIAVTEMGERHLFNAARMLQRSGYTEHDPQELLHCGVPRGEMAQDAYFYEVDCALRTYHPALRMLLDELRRRGRLSCPLRPRGTARVAAQLHPRLIAARGRKPGA